MLEPKLTLMAKFNDMSIYEIIAPFDKALFSLRDSGIEPISSRDLAYARIKGDINGKLVNSEGFTREGFLISRKFYIAKDSVLLSSTSPLLMNDLAKRVVEANEKYEYLITDKFVYNAYREIAEKDKIKNPEERKVIILPQKKSYRIPANRFNEDELTLFLFKDIAKEYGDFLMGADINQITVCPLDSLFFKGTLLTQLYSGVSLINGILDSLQHYNSFFGSTKNQLK